MNELQIFNNPEFGELRTFIEPDGKVLYCATDAARALGYTNPRFSVNKHCPNVSKRSVRVEIGTKADGTPISRPMDLLFAPEGDIYRLMYRAADQSRSPDIKAKAERYGGWIFDEVLPSIRKTGSYSTRGNLESEKIAAQRDRAKAMLLNAQTRRYNAIMKTIDNKKLSPIAAEVFGLAALEQATGEPIHYRPECERTYSATEIGKMFGVSSQKIGKLANAKGLKADAYGVTVMDKSPYSAKEVSAFRYNQKAVDKIKKLLQSL